MKNHTRQLLGLYFHNLFTPIRLPNASANTIHQYRNAIVKLTMFMGHNVRVGEVNDDLLQRFYEWSLKHGLSLQSARQYKSLLRSIIRHARPGMCPKHPGKRPHEASAVGLDDERWDCEGSVWRFFHQKYRPEKMVGSTDGSIEQHEIKLRRFCRWHGKAVLLTDLTDELVTAFMQSMLDKGYSRATVNNTRSAILCVWRYAHKKKLVQSYPTVDKLKEHRRLPVAWSIPELERLLSACAATPGTIAGVPAGDYWPAMILVMYDTGLRKGAVLSIERQHVDLSTGWLTVPADHQKQKVEQRFLLSDQTVDAIRRIWPPRDQLLFYWPWGPRQIFIHFGKILARNGLPSTRLDKFHKLRKTCGSHIAKVAGIDAASRQLGHSGEYVTKLYVDPQIAQSAIDGVVHLPRPRLSAPNDDGEK